MAEYYERETLIDALMMYTWRDEGDREIDGSDEEGEMLLELLERGMTDGE